MLWLAFQAGGYFPTGYLPAGAALWGACAVVLAIRPPAYRVGTHALLGLGALAGLAAWTGLSTAWSLDAPSGLEEAQRTLVYVGLFGLGILAAGSGRLAAAVVWLLGAVALTVVLAGLLERLLPDGASVLSAAGYRLDHPLTYFNAFGALASLTAVLHAGLAGDPRGRLALRALAAAASLSALVAMYFTLSRGAWLALGVGVLVLLVVSPHRRTAIVSVAIVGTLFAIALLRLRAYPALVDDPALGVGQDQAGRDFLPELAALVALAAGAQALVVWTQQRWAWRLKPLARGARQAVPYAAGLVLVGAVAGYAANSSRIEARANDAGDYIERQWDDFSATSRTPGGTARLTSASGTRSDLYGVAIDAWTDRPLAGDGAGSFRARYARERDAGQDARNAHSLYLETLSDTGLIGFALLAAFLASLVMAASRAIRRPTGLTSASAAAVTAAVAVWAAHSAVDWDWQMTSLTGLALLLAATLYAPGRRRRSSSADGRRRKSARSASAGGSGLRGLLASPHAGARLAAVGCLLLAGYLAMSARDADRVRDGIELIQRGEYGAAAERVRGVDLEPAAAQATIVRAYAARGQGDERAAEKAFADAVRMSPNDWSIRRVRAINLLNAGDRRGARRQIERALELNPLMRLPSGFQR